MGRKLSSGHIMSRGRIPGVAIHEAARVCSQDGSRVLLIGGDHESADLVVLGNKKVKLVRVRRPHNVLTDPGDVAAQYSREIAELRKIPAPGMVEKVLMLREPDGSWFRFWIFPDSLEVAG